MNIKLIVPFVLLALILAVYAVSAPQTVEEDATFTSVPETATAIEEPTKEPAPTRDFDNNPPAGAEREFVTDFSQHSVSYLEI